jgi:hypothetical protein
LANLCKWKAKQRQIAKQLKEPEKINKQLVVIATKEAAIEEVSKFAKFLAELQRFVCKNLLDVNLLD